LRILASNCFVLSVCVVYAGNGVVLLRQLGELKAEHFACFLPQLRKTYIGLLGLELLILEALRVSGWVPKLHAPIRTA
jgi:hypothetical protein